MTDTETRIQSKIESVRANGSKGSNRQLRSTAEALIEIEDSRARMEKWHANFSNRTGTRRPKANAMRTKNGVWH